MIEFELRSLPGVVAASVQDSGVALLVLPDVDADALQVVAAAVLATHGVEAAIRVLGGTSSPSVRSQRARRVAVGAIGAISGIGVLASAAGVAAMAGVLPMGPDAAPQPATPEGATAMPRESTARQAAADITVLPGEQPSWAAGEGAWPLPAALPPAPVVVPAPVLVPIPAAPARAAATAAVAPAPPQPEREIDPPIDKLPRALPDAAPTATADIGPSQPESSGPDVEDVATDEHPTTDDDWTADPDEDGEHHGRGADRRHLGWTNGPDQASPRSSAGDAPRGGRA